MFIFYFEVEKDLVLVMRHASWSLDNYLLVQHFYLGISSSNFSFNYSMILNQIHDLSMDWRSGPIVSKIAEKVERILEVEKFFLSTSIMRVAQVKVSFDLNNSLVLDLFQKVKYVG